MTADARATTATEFFDQFDLTEITGTWPDGPSRWCPRHWAPGELLGCDGHGAALELTRIWVTEHAPPNMRSAAMMKRQLAKAGPLCCVLGDEQMYQLWGHWPPAAEAPAEGGSAS